MSETIAPEALVALPVFPLPGTLLLPQTLVSLHVFEPRYRQMMAHVLDSHRALAVAMLDERGQPDAFGRPPLCAVAGVGLIRRSARLPDGRYNILVEGVLRADISHELPPAANIPFRRVHARALADVTVPSPSLSTASSTLRALCVQVVSELGGADPDVLERLAEIQEPGALADLVAAAALQDPDERQKILAELDVGRRIELATSALGGLLLQADRKSEPPAWGIGSGVA